MQLSAPALIGRHAELAALDAALERTVKRRGGAVFLTGEAGIGKSRLARETASRAFSTGMRVLRGRASTLSTAVPFRPLTEALLGLFRNGEAPDYPELVPYRPVLGRLIPEWHEPSPTGGGESLVILAEAVLRLLALAGRDGGCLLALDDLQDADAETLTVIEYLVDNLERQPVLLLATMRAENGPAFDLVSGAGRRAAATLVPLRPLDGEDMRRLVAACLNVPADAVPEPLLDRLRRDCDGNPFIAEEMLGDWVGSGALTPVGERWRVVGELTSHVPTSLVRSVADRADRLGPEARGMLCAAAVLGRRFPLTVLQAMTGLDDRSLLRHLHAAFTAQLLVPDEQSTDWYAFRHALTAEALIAGVGPTRRRELAASAADAIERLHPDLPGEWCQLTAHLRMVAGARSAAGRLLAVAGRRALVGGAANSAVALLDRARECLTDRADAAARADVLENLIHALLEAGQIDRALAFASTLDGTDAGALSADRRTALHTQLAWVAAVAGRSAEGVAQVNAARALSGSADGDRTAGIDVAAAYLALHGSGTDRLEVAEALARRAIDAAERVPLPVVACQAWQLLGLLARRRSFDESTRSFERMAALADAHELPIWRIHALVKLAGNDGLRDGSTGRLVQAREEAMRAGAVAVGYGLDASLAFQAVLFGDYQHAADLIDSCLPAIMRLHFTDTAHYALTVKAALAAHQGRRAEMEHVMAEFTALGGDRSAHLPLASGQCHAICALLEEDRDRAVEALVRAGKYEEANPTIYHLAGRHGLRLLLRALAGELTEPEYEHAVAAASSQLRWNRQFALLAGAVLLGRAGRPDAADSAVAQAQEAAAPFVMARHLGARLVAEAAIADGWGDPVSWLRGAEDYFHAASVPAVASACRGLLRTAGASVSQRRTGHERIPDELRRNGVTIREYEVMELLVGRLGNKEIAGRLHISPRTVEKHIASLIAKTGQADRSALSAYAGTIAGGATRG